MAKRITEDEKDRMRELRDGGMTYKEIALSVGRGKTAVSYICNLNTNAKRIANQKKQDVIAKRKAYEQRPEVREMRKRYKNLPGVREKQRTLERSIEWKETRRSYMESDRGKMVRKTYSKSQAGKERLRKYREKTQVRLAARLRKRLRKAIKNNYKSGSAVGDLGCSIVDLKTYLEKQFELGMSWDNWAVDGWHIDHIKPLASFDLTDRAQFLEACHYTNLQPLWAKDNLSKGAKLDVGKHKIIDNGGD